VNSCEHTDMTSVNNDLQNTWPCIRRRVVLRWKKAVVYFLLNYSETPHRDLGNAFIPLNLKATT